MKILVLLLIMIGFQPVLSFVGTIAGPEGKKIIEAIGLLGFTAIAISNWIMVNTYHKGSLIGLIFRIIIIFFFINSLFNLRSLAPITQPLSDITSQIELPQINLGPGWLADILRSIGSVLNSIFNFFAGLFGGIFYFFNNASKMLGYLLWVYLVFFRFTKE